jgi:hypothetical protein
MSSNTVILIAIAAVAVVAIIIALIVHGQQKAKRRRLLRDRFGPEYDRLVAAAGSSAAAEKELEVRQKRAARFNIRALTREEQTRFAARWQQVQAEFVENPKASLGHADDLLAGVMAARGYPVQDFDQRSADLSVDYPVVVQHYHAAHDIALRHKKGDATTEDMRQAMIHYRALFEDLVSDAAAVAPVAVNIPHAAE